MDEIAALASRGRHCLMAGDHDGLRQALDRNFDARCRLYPLNPRHVRLVELARSLGASANYAGSGGAIVAIPSDASDLGRTRDGLRRAGYETVTPVIG